MAAAHPSADFEIAGFSARIWDVQARADYGSSRGGLDGALVLIREPIQLARARGFNENLAWSLGISVVITEDAGHTGTDPLDEVA